MTTSLPLDDARTILDCLEHYAGRNPAERAYTFLTNGEDREVVLSYQELHARAQAYAQELNHRGLSRKAVLLLFPSGLEFIVAFFGCLYAGAVAVPANLARNSHHSARLLQIIQDSGAEAVLTIEQLRGSVRDGLLSAGVDTSRVDVLCEADVSQSGALRLPLANQLAFLQYTSGSTGRPKGVMVTHAQLLANERAIQRAANLPEHFSCAGWLPQFHDMGLIGTTLQPIAMGGHYVFISPLHFVQRPLRWLEMLSRYGSEVTAAPNFGLDLCAKATLDKSVSVMDLSALRTIFCGAEPVNAVTISKFAAKFAPFGLRADAIQPCYGLAESTLIVSGGAVPDGGRAIDLRREALAAGRVEVGGANAQTVVCCGTPVPGHTAVIVDPATRRALGDDQVGEVWVCGPSVAAGYWRNPSETVTTFGAMTSCGRGPFMRTGDLGFLRNGGLFITGRIKELLIVRGRNLYPHDIESTVIDAVAPYGEVQAAVFAGGSDDTPVVISYVELPRRAKHDSTQDFPFIARKLRQVVSEAHDVLLRDIYFVACGTIPRTSSGKVQRSRCAAMYESREIDLSSGTLFSTREAAELSN